MSTIEQKGYDSVAVANQFLLVARKKGESICSLTKLIKLVYIAHGYRLALKGRSLIKDRIEAWRYGPVIPRLYHAFRREKPVPEPLEPKQSDCDEFDEDVLPIIEAVYRGYGHLNFSEISQLTHKKGTPWDMVYRNQGNGGEIENELIREYYYGLIESA